MTREACGLGALALCLLTGPALEGRPSAVVQPAGRPQPDTYHWVLPAQHGGVEIVDLHPGDCYVIQQVDGVAYFGDPLPGAFELQRLLGEPLAHLVESTGEHAECTLAGCVDAGRLTGALAALFLDLGTPQGRRPANHRPTPLDGMRGGAYSDVGSDERARYRQAPEQRMVYRHLRTAGRENCYEAEVPRTLTIHVRDGQRRPDRTGVYSGYLYLEHHHPAPARRAAKLHGFGPLRHHTVLHEETRHP